jgi:hypothetical protein
MVVRQFWIEKIEESWKRRNILWLSGVRRVGKTCLASSLDHVTYLDCELPSTRKALEDPETLLEAHQGRRLVLDEIHRLRNPSEVLKIAADHYPSVRILATGSSTLGASARFRDTLAGRKHELWLTPIITEDMGYFDNPSIEHRLLCGGLPPFFMAKSPPDKDYQEWLDAFWAKDILELFRLERRFSFMRFVELLFSQSGGMFEASRFAIPCEVSRTTIGNYLSVLEATFVFHLLRPFSTHRSTEIVSAPKVYAFDSGFVCFYKGWTSLRTEDLGLLWEHFVLNELQAKLQTRNIHYWRDKSGHEVDFVLKHLSNPLTAIEAKWSASAFDPSSLLALRQAYPEGRNFVVSRDTHRQYARRIRSIQVEFVGLSEFLEKLEVRRPA